MPAQHTKNAGKIQSAGPALAVQVEQIARQRAHRRRGLAGQRALFGQTQVLQHQIDTEPATVVARRRHALHHARTRVIDVQHPVVAAALAHHLRHHLRVEPVGDAKPDGLAGADHLDAEQHVVADFHRLAGAMATGMEHRPPHDLQQRPRPFQRGGVTADHEGQLAVAGTGRPAGHRRIDHVEAAFGRLFRHPARAVRGNGRAVDQQRAGCGGVEDAARRQITLFDMLAGRQHGDDHIRPGHGIGGRHRDLSAGRGQLLQRGGDQVEAAHGMAGREQVAGHRQAHIAQTDKSDGMRHDETPRLSAWKWWC